MAKWSDQIERQLADELARCEGKVRFEGDDAGSLWLWQADRRTGIKDAMALDLPTVYGPPKARLVQGQADTAGKHQLWAVETEANLVTDVHLVAGLPIAERPATIAMNLTASQNPAAHQIFCEQVNSLGLTGVSVTPRCCTGNNELKALAEVYLGLGKSYAGTVVGDLLRVIDHVESLLQIESEPIILITSGIVTPLALALAAIDQRIGGLIVDFGGDDSHMQPSGTPPFFVDQFGQLGANPLLTLAQCCVPRPMLLIDYPLDAPSWLSVAESIVLPFRAKLDRLRETFRTAGHPTRLQTIESAEIENRIDVLASFLETHFITQEQQ